MLNNVCIFENLFRYYKFICKRLLGMSDLNEIRTSSRRAGRLNFFLLWQGQFVSSAGDAVYELALGFFLLRQYHSGAVTTLVLALSAVPGILTAPFAGVVIDRADGGRGPSVFGNKKTILAAADLTRGACVIALGAAALLGHAPLWLLLLAGVAAAADRKIPPDAGKLPAQHCLPRHRNGGQHRRRRAVCAARRAAAVFSRSPRKISGRTVPPHPETCYNQSRRHSPAPPSGGGRF